MTALQAAIAVLREAGEPLHYEEITRRILAGGLWTTSGLTPEATLGARLSQSVKNEGDASPYVRTRKGTYGLRDGSLLGFSTPAPIPPPTPPIKAPKTLSFTNAAERVLSEAKDHRPLHYRVVAHEIIERGLVKSNGQTPEATLYASIHEEVRRQHERGERPRFALHKKGYLGLSKWQGEGLAFHIERHNAEVRKRLVERLKAMDPYAFETLVSRLLVALGFDVEVTKKSGDGGIDVRGTLVVGDTVRTRMAVQVKRWKDNVQAPIVQQVRGSLGAHEQGMIITTGGFSKGARDEAERADATPVGLMDGEQLARLLVEHELGVRRQPVYLLDLLSEEITTPEADVDLQTLLPS